jgi:hypothetical protein
VTAAKVEDDRHDQYANAAHMTSFQLRLIKEMPELRIQKKNNALETRAFQCLEVGK